MQKPMKPDFTSSLPKGSCRNQVTSVLDVNTGRIVAIVNALDVKDLDPTVREQPVAQKSYYLRYRVSEDSGTTWQFDEPIIQTGDFAAQHPIPGVYIGENAIYLGDVGCIPIVTKKDKFLCRHKPPPWGQMMNY